MRVVGFLGWKSGGYSGHLFWGFVVLVFSLCPSSSSTAAIHVSHPQLNYLSGECNEVWVQPGRLSMNSDPADVNDAKAAEKVFEFNNFLQVRLKHMGNYLSAIRSAAHIFHFIC
ncbi:hypothetical protein BaRGS_00000099 [Batillaria attramentaria]|uniref:Uncharacterized protein n=1 Tax=Batillaria attramentaria TaxID=370345 RepID=A0ABD0MC51_9CAEN